jgi:PAS domain S-box-containing protein
VALLLLFVLGGSFWLVFDDLKQEFLSDFEQDLKASGTAFRSAETQRFRSLATIAGFLEGSPAFRNVLRRSDYQTVYQYLVDVGEPTDADVILITDAQGQLLVRSDREGDKGLSLAETPVFEDALLGAYAEGYWSDGESLFQIVSLPLVDSFDYVDGTLTLGIEIDESFLKRLADELRVEVAYQGQTELPPTSTLLETSPENFLTEQLVLAPDKNIVIAKSLVPISQFVWRSRWKLVEIGSVALVIALLISIPLIGRITNPVELLEIAEAEMKTIFRTNLDGLIFVDEHGRISTCNPAATVALGFEEKDLLRQPLMERLPSEVLAQLDDAAGGTQSATFTRQGHDFQLYRTFIRRQASETLGSILLIHDVTAERERERLFDQFLCQLQRSSEQSESREFAFGIKNLRTWSEIKAEKLETQAAPLDLAELEKSLKEEWADCDRLALEFPPEGQVLADRNHLLLSLHNLIFFSLQRSEGDVTLVIERDGGSFRFSILGRLADTGKPPGETDFHQGDPWHSDHGALALGIFVASKLVAEHHSRLSFAQTESGERIAFHLPKAVKET